MALLGRLMATLRGGGPLDQAWLDQAATPDDTRQSMYALAEEYYSGFETTRDTGSSQPRLSDRAKQYLERSGLVFNENFMEPIIDAFAERLTLTGFTFSDTEEDQTTSEDSATNDTLADLEQWAANVWAKNRMDSKQGTVHTTMLNKGDAYVIVDWDAARGLPRVSFNRPESIPHCAYDDENADMVAWASKVWTTKHKSVSNPTGKAIERMNVYLPDRVEKYYRLTSGESSSGGWERFYEAAADSWPTGWVRSSGEPRGVPVFHFRHKPLGTDYGRSENRGNFPFQDELNKFVIDLNDVMDAQGWPQRYAVGISGADDLKPQPGTLLKSANENATFGQFDPADPAGMLAAIEGCLARLARRSRTPMHLLVGGTPPSGEALKTAESGLVAKVRKAMTPTGNSWEDVLGMALRLEVDFGTAPAVIDEENLVIEAVWDDPETRNDLAEAQTAEILSSLGVSKHSILARLGFSYDDEQKWKAKEAETLDEAAGALLDSGAGGDVYGTAETAATGANGADPATLVSGG